MWKIVLYALLFQTFETVTSSMRSIPVIHNVSLMMFNSNSTIINGTCQQCLCNILLNTTSFSSLNCFWSNTTCQMFSQSLQTGSFMLVNNTPSSFYFFSWPIEVTTSVTNEMTTEVMAPYVEYLWTFDSTYRDLSGTFNATPMNGVGFSSSTITGYGSSVPLSSTSNQWIQIDAPFLNLSYHSWTFEVWIYLWTLNSSIDYTITSQCDSSTTDRCFHLLIRSAKVYIGFYADDMPGLTSLVPSMWYHIAVVFDTITLNRSIYLNGVLDKSGIAGNVYLGNSGSLMIGMFPIYGSNNGYFNGLIDQLSYTNRVKSSSEILDDATLMLYFPFDNGSIYDNGPLRINGSLFGSTSVVSGRIGDAIQFGLSANDSYFQVSGLVLLGTDNHPYSMSIWIEPTVINASSIIHVSSLNSGFGWCVGMLSMTSSGQLIATSYNGNSFINTGMGTSLIPNHWTHAVSTYSTLNGLRLYINGTLFNSSVPFTYVASGSPDYLFLASSLNGGSCGGQHGQFIGILDEFRLYSRELTVTDVRTLFNM